MKHKILRVQPRYTMIIWAIAFAACLTLVFLGQIAGWDTSGITPILWYCLMGSCALVSLIILFYYLQFAIVDDDGITIRGLFYKIVKIRWNEIAAITCEKIVTYDNKTNVFLSWLIIKRDPSEHVHGRAGRNKRNESPWCIIATKRNLEIIKKFHEIKL